jgi:hypothetical protein
MPTTGNFSIGSIFDGSIFFTEPIVQPDCLGGNDRIAFAADVVGFIF